MCLELNPAYLGKFLYINQHFVRYEIGCRLQKLSIVDSFEEVGQQLTKKGIEAVIVVNKVDKTASSNWDRNFLGCDLLVNGIFNKISKENLLTIHNYKEILLSLKLPNEILINVK